MKRFGVRALIFLVATIVFGHVGPGFAQTGDDDTISGASGRSVRANVLVASWTWTAPATGLVTFDTRGSDFDILLSVFHSASFLPIASNLDLANLTYSSELRFTAQQAQTYSITATRVDGSFDPGTIVLNWQASLSVDSEDDDSISGAQVAEPPYDGTVYIDPDIITETDPTTFQGLDMYPTPQPRSQPMYGTARHGLGTTLSYVVAGTTDVLAEVEFVGYALHNGRWVLVVFNDPPQPEDSACHGMTHEYWDLETSNWVACLRDGEVLGELTPHSGTLRFPMVAGDTWSQVMSWTDHVRSEYSSNGTFRHSFAVKECGVEVKVPAGEFTTCRVEMMVRGNSGDVVHETRWYDPALDLVVKTDAGGVVYELWDYDLNGSPLRFGSTGQNEHILSGNAATIHTWTAPDGTPKATRYTSADGTVQVGTLYDAEGLPELIVDEIDGWQIQVKSGAGDFGAWAVYDIFDDQATYQGSWLVTDYEEDQGIMR